MGAGTLADTLIFGDDFGSALVSNVGANLAFAAAGRGLRYLRNARAIRAMRGVGEESIWPIPRASDVAEPLGGRVTGRKGYAYNVRNKGGGELWVVRGKMSGNELAPLVDDFDGPVNVVSAGHGSPNGEVELVKDFFEADVWRWRGKQNIQVEYLGDLVKANTVKVALNSPGRVIAAWCYSDVCKYVVPALR